MDFFPAEETFKLYCVGLFLWYVVSILFLPESKKTMSFTLMWILSHLTQYLPLFLRDAHVALGYTLLAHKLTMLTLVTLLVYVLIFPNTRNWKIYLGLFCALLFQAASIYILEQLV